MNDNSLTNVLIREFLLGKVNEDERERIERLFLTNSDVREKVLAVEESLVDEYLENSMASPDVERFLDRYCHTPTQRRKLRVRQTVREWALSHSESERPVKLVTSRLRRLREFVRQKTILMIPATATAIVVVVVGALWVSERLEQRKRHESVERELARLNESSNTESSRRTSVTLSPISARSLQSEPEVQKQSDTQVIQLRLLWTQQKKFPAYKVTINRFGDLEMFSVNQLYPEPNGAAVNLKLPADFLFPGRYSIKLNGVGDDSLIEVYSCLVSSNH